jgi:hypothetical protein
MELGCVVLIAMGFIIIISLIQSISDKLNKTSGQTGNPTIYTSSNNYNGKVRITGSNDLTSWALHKHPQDIEDYDYSNPSVLDADVVIHREGGVNKVVKGPDKGRILTDWEVDELEEDEY